MEEFLKDGERIDEIGFGNLRLIQKPEDFCYGVDAVLLATFAEIGKNAKVIDLGTGTGIIPMILSHRTQASEIIGVEIQANSYERAARNVILNELSGRVRMIHSDVKNLINSKLADRNVFDAVLSNPPYVKGDGGLKNRKGAKAIARHETTASLSDFISEAASLLRDRGDFYMVHRPSRLVDISVLCRQHMLEPKRLRFVSPNRDSAPNILLIHCVKHGRPQLNILDPLYIYREDGSYTDEIMKLYERK
jgi:tRNA1Val (adenine37-N6)-methyltransferase